MRIFRPRRAYVDIRGTLPDDPRPFSKILSDLYEAHRWDALATYNAERSRGLVHAPEWVERMAKEQEQFNAQMLREASERGEKII